MRDYKQSNHLQPKHLPILICLFLFGIFFFDGFVRWFVKWLGG